MHLLDFLRSEITDFFTLIPYGLRIFLPQFCMSCVVKESCHAHDLLFSPRSATHHRISHSGEVQSSRHMFLDRYNPSARAAQSSHSIRSKIVGSVKSQPPQFRLRHRHFVRASIRVVRTQFRGPGSSIARGENTSATLQHLWLSDLPFQELGPLE